MKSKYSRRLAAGFFLYSCGLLAWAYLASQNHSPYRYWLVLLPLLPILYITVTFHGLLSEKDELWRKIITESLAFSANASAWTCASYVFLRGMGAPEFRAEWAFYILVAYFLIGYLVSCRRYFSRRGDSCRGEK